MACGIYKMTNSINGKIYIGLSINIETRMYNHYWSAFKTSASEYNSYLSRAIRKYGKENFSYEIIEECSISALPSRERYWIEHYNSTDRNIGYNVSSGGEGNSSWGEEETNKIITYYQEGKSAEEISFLTGRTESSIQNRLHLLGIRSPKYWTSDELQLLEELVLANRTPSYIATILDRTVSSVVHQMKRKNLKRKHYWTPEEEKELIKMLADKVSIKEIVENLGRSESSIRSKIWRYGLNEKNG